MNNYKVIIADDHKMVRSGFCRVLESLTSIEQIDEADNGIELLKLVAKAKYDLIILDINMPHLNGIETVKKLRAADTDTKILILTMHLDDNLIIDALQEGVNGYLFKNSDIDELLNAVENILQGNEYFSEEVKEKVLKYHSQRKKSSFSSIKKEKIPISKREREIIKLLSEGFKSHEIAQKLYISESTVVKHRKNIIRKLNLKNTAEVVRFALQNEII